MKKTIMMTTYLFLFLLYGCGGATSTTKEAIVTNGESIPGYSNEAIENNESVNEFDVETNKEDLLIEEKVDKSIDSTGVDSQIDWISYETRFNSEYIIPSDFEDISPKVTAAGIVNTFTDKDGGMIINIGEVPVASTPIGFASGAISNDYEIFCNSINVESRYYREGKEFYIQGSSNEKNQIYWERTNEEILFTLDISWVKDNSDYYERIASRVIENYKIPNYVEIEELTKNVDTIFDVSNYLSNIRSIENELDNGLLEETTDDIGHTVRYENNGFRYVFTRYTGGIDEFYFENKDNNGIELYDIAIGDVMDSAKEKMEKAGYEMIYEMIDNTYFVNEKDLQVGFRHDSNGIITSWSITNSLY